MNDPQIGHACGVFGVYAPGQTVAHLTYLGLYALQHRGQESAGIAVSDGETITVSRTWASSPRCSTSVGSPRSTATSRSATYRYSTTGSSSWRNAQPVYRSVGDAGFALGHNGNLTNTVELAERLGMLPGLDARRRPASTPPPTPRSSPSSSPHEYAAEPRSDGRDLEHRARSACSRDLAGGFSFVLMDEAHLIGVRDPHGFWPLVLGRVESGWVLASETAALDIVGAHFVREVEPGEMIVIDAIGRARAARSPSPIRSSACSSSSTSRVPTPTLYGHSVHAARQRMGEELARQAPVDADMVMPVPESGIPAAQGYARAPGIPYGDGLVKNRYVGRTFIQPSQKQRGQGVRLKLNPLPENIRGKRLVVVDDSIVRGTTTKQVVRCCARPARPRCTSGCRRRRTSGRAPTAWTPAAAPSCSRPTCRSARSRDFLERRLARLPRARPPHHGHRRAGRRRSAPRASPASTRCRCRSTDSKLVLEDDARGRPDRRPTPR